MSPRLETIRLVLRTLRTMVSSGTLKGPKDTRVAYIFPPEGVKHWSLTRAVADQANLPHGTVSDCLGMLVRDGFLQPGKKSARMPRWVRLYDDYPDE